MDHTPWAKPLQPECPSILPPPCPVMPLGVGGSGKVAVTGSLPLGMWHGAQPPLTCTYRTWALGACYFPRTSQGGCSRGCPAELTSPCTASGSTVPSTWTGRSPKSGRKPQAGIREEQSCLQKTVLIPQCPAAYPFQDIVVVKSPGLSHLCHMRPARSRHVTDLLRPSTSSSINGK